MCPQTGPALILCGRLNFLLNGCLIVLLRQNKHDLSKKAWISKYISLTYYPRNSSNRYLQPNKQAIKTFSDLNKYARVNESSSIDLFQKLNAYTHRKLKHGLSISRHFALFTQLGTIQTEFSYTMIIKVIVPIM